MKKFILISILLSNNLLGQELDSTQIYILDEQLANQTEDIDISNILSDFELVESEKFNLNGADVFDVKKLDKLSVFKLNNLYSYLRDNGEIYDYWELLSLPNFTKDDIAYIKTKTIIQPFSNKILFKDLIGKTNNDLIIRYKQKLKQDNNNYFGTPYSLMLRYKSQLSQFIDFGFSAEKDAGEKLMKGIKPFDFNSFYLQFKSNNAIKKIIIGSYYANFGQGLSLWNSYKFNNSFGEDPFVNNSFRPHSGVSEGKFFKGIASSFSFGKIDLDIMYSNRNIDANIDTIANSFSSIIENGYHRNEVELARKEILKKVDLAGIISFKKNNLKLSTGFIQTKFDSYFQVDSSKYLKNFNSKQNSFKTIMVYGIYSFKDLIINGEISTNIKNPKLANFQLIFNYHPLDDFNFNFVKRKIHPENFNFNQASFSMNTKYGEDVIKISSTWEVLARTKVFIYWENSKTLAFSNDSNSITMRTLLGFKIETALNKYNSAQIKHSINQTLSVKYSQTQLRIKSHLSSNVSLSLDSKIRLYNKNEISSLQTLELEFKALNNRFNLKTILSHFNISSWQNRIYSFEPDILYSFGIQSFNNKGNRIAFVSKFSWTNTLQFWLKYSNTFTQDNLHLFSYQPEIKLQLRIKF